MSSRGFTPGGRGAPNLTHDIDTRGDRQTRTGVPAVGMLPAEVGRLSGTGGDRLDPDPTMPSERAASRAFLMGLSLPGQAGIVVEEHLDELAELARSTGMEVVGRSLQNRRAPDARTLIGRGKAGELARVAAESEADVVIFDDDLTPRQVRNLEQVVECAVIDRSDLILDLFVRRARTREARTQVEMARLEYQLPRLTRRWTPPVSSGWRYRGARRGGRDPARGRPAHDTHTHQAPEAGALQDRTDA